jgi:predicted membrane protein
MHLRRTFNALAQKSGEASFTTAGNLLWWGAILTIILVGLVLIFVAWIFATIGFFTMKSRQYQQYTPQPNGSTLPSTQPELGKMIESKGMNKNKYAKPETLGRRGI